MRMRAATPMNVIAFMSQFGVFEAAGVKRQRPGSLT
jgi:hypothetical protein